MAGDDSAQGGGDANRAELCLVFFVFLKSEEVSVGKVRFYLGPELVVIDTPEEAADGSVCCRVFILRETDKDV